MDPVSLADSDKKITVDDPAGVPPAGGKPRFLKVALGVVLATGLLLLKLKGLVFLALTKFKLLLVNPLEGFGVAQFAWTGGSMAVTIGAYAFKFGLAFAVGFVLLTVVHELGHAVMIRAKGLRASAMVFIPFVGGAVTLKDQPRSAFDDAQIGLAGPVAGTLASMLCLVIYRQSADSLYLVLAFAGFILNLFNLMPIGPLDGGRIAAAISKWMWVLGGGILVYLLVEWKNPLMIPVLLLGVYQIYKTITGDYDRLFYSVTIGQRSTIAVFYFGLIFLLGYETLMVHAELLALQAS